MNKKGCGCLLATLALTVPGMTGSLYVLNTSEAQRAAHLEWGKSLIPQRANVSGEAELPQADVEEESKEENINPREDDELEKIMFAHVQWGNITQDVDKVIQEEVKNFIERARSLGMSEQDRGRIVKQVMAEKNLGNNEQYNAKFQSAKTAIKNKKIEELGQLRNDILVLVRNEFRGALQVKLEKELTGKVSAVESVLTPAKPVTEPVAEKFTTVVPVAGIKEEAKTPAAAPVTPVPDAAEPKASTWNLITPFLQTFVFTPMTPECDEIIREINKLLSNREIPNLIDPKTQAEFDAKLYSLLLRLNDKDYNRIQTEYQDLLPARGRSATRDEKEI